MSVQNKCSFQINLLVLSIITQTAHNKLKTLTKRNEKFTKSENSKTQKTGKFLIKLLFK